MTLTIQDLLRPCEEAGLVDVELFQRGYRP